jgi:hypothetical protein
MKVHLLRTIYLTSFVSYAVFLLAEIMRPGFVGHIFSVHIFLPTVIVSGAMHMIFCHECEGVQSRKINFLTKVLASLILIFLLTEIKEVVTGMFIPLLFVVALLPWLVDIWLNAEDAT